jgi:hypothetical protein
MGMKEVMNEPHGAIRNTVTQPRKTGDDAPIKNAVTQKKRQGNTNIKNASTPDPNSNKVPVGGQG